MKKQFDILVQTVQRTLQSDAQDLAATIAFWAFFSIFPLLIGILALTGYFLESEELRARVLEALTDLLPGSADFVTNNVESVMNNRGTLSWLGIGGVLWSAGKGFGAVTRAINRTIGAKRTHLALLSSVRSFLTAVAVAILMIVSIAITAFVEVVLDPSVLSSLGVSAVQISDFERFTMSFILIFSMFALVYRYAPYIKVRWRQVLPGALLAAVLFELGKAGFVFYLDRVAHFEMIYGPMTSIIVLLLWLYVSSLILILGAEYNIVRDEAVDAAPGETPERPDVSPS